MSESDALSAFRSETRAFLEENCPSEMHAPMTDKNICWGGRDFVFESEAQKLWMERMAARGWTVPMWPAAYGGGGLSADEGRILAEEMKRINARPPLQSFGIWMLGPALLQFGSEEQKKALLPDIVHGRTRWCQGYSEPGSGSDLASLQTKGEDKGDYYLINGQKVWTSNADEADWIFCLVRTEPDVPKHKGISFLLFDMKSSGVEARPIRLISGASPFCETFFTDVKVPKEQIVGERGQGWTIAKYLLTHERESIGAADQAHFGANDPVAMAGDLPKDALGRLDDPMLRAELGQFALDESTFSAHTDATRAFMRAGGVIGARSSELKYLGSELNKRRLSLVMQVAGSDGLEWSADGNDAGLEAQKWLRTKGNSIEGGTSEVMLGIIAKALLQLPNEGA